MYSQVKPRGEVLLGWNRLHRHTNAGNVIIDTFIQQDRGNSTTYTNPRSIYCQQEYPMCQWFRFSIMASRLRHYYLKITCKTWTYVLQEKNILHEKKMLQTYLLVRKKNPASRKFSCTRIFFSFHIARKLQLS